MVDFSDLYTSTIAYLARDEVFANSSALDLISDQSQTKVFIARQSPQALFVFLPMIGSANAICTLSEKSRVSK